MPVHSKDFVDVAARARELGCRIPVTAALLPGNFSTAAHAGEFCFHAATPHVRSAWQDVGLDDEGPDPARDMTQSSSIGIVSQAGTSDRVPSCIQAVRKVLDLRPGANNESAKVPLVVFFGSGLLSAPAWRLTVALGMVSSVLASHPRRAGPRNIRLDIVVGRPGNRGYRCIEYQGDAVGIIALAREVRRIWASE